MNYLILGAGPAGVIAAETLATTDPSGKVTLIGAEPEAPYSRMAIPYLLAGNIAEEGTHLRHGEGHYEKLGINLLPGKAARLSPKEKTVTLEDGSSLAYDRLLIATGSHTTRPPIKGMDLDGIENCWTLKDARKIIAATKPGSRVVLLGAGFIGCIVLEALAMRKVELTVIEMADRMLARMMDDTGAGMLKSWCEDKGVKIMTGAQVTGVARSGGGLTLALKGGGSVESDFVVCATGVAPNIGFLEGSGVKIDAGILVDDHLATSVDGIWAAGDVAQGPEFLTGKQVVHAIQTTASEHGRIAALNMAGHETSYRGSLAMNVLNTLGLISSSYGDWEGVKGGERVEAIDAGHFRYLRLCFDGDVVVGALALGLTQHVGAIRGLVQTKVRLGEWKDMLMKDPNRVMDAYLARTQGSA